MSGWREWIAWTMLAFALYIAGFLLPAVGFIFFLAASIPFLVLTVRQGGGKSALGVVVTTLLAGSALNLAAAFFYLIGFGMPALGLGMLLKKKREGTAYLMAGIAFVLLCKLLLLAVITQVTGVNPFNLDLAQMRQAFQPLMEKGLLPFSLDGGTPEQVELAMKEMAKSISFYMPTLLITYVVVEVFCVSRAASFVLWKMGGEPLFCLPPFGAWRFPRDIVWALLAGMLLSYIGEKNSEYALMAQSGGNLQEIIRMLFLIQGLAVLWYCTESRGVPRLLRVLFVVVTPAVFVLSYIVSMVGMLDIWFDIRARIRGKQT